MSQDISLYFPVAQFGEITAQQEVAYGMSGATVRSVTTTQGSYVLRIFHRDQTSWDSTLAIHRMVADSGIAPPLLHIDQQHRATVSQKIAASSFGAAVAQPALQQAAFMMLTAMLAQLHALPVHGLAARSAVEFAHGVWTAQSQRPGFPAWAAPLATRLTGITALLAQDDRQVLSHGDLNPTNILWDGTRVWLVDWDGAGLSHPYLDLATIANFLSLSDETAIALLAMQEQSSIDIDQQEIFRACRDLARIVYGCVFLSLVPDLSQLAFPSREQTATLSQCFSRVVGGELSLASIEGQALTGAAFFKQVADI